MAKLIDFGTGAATRQVFARPGLFGLSALFTLLVVTLLVSASLMPAEAAGDEYSVLGRLTQFGEPVEGALVHLEATGSQGDVRVETVSGADGSYAFSKVPAGSYRLVPTKDNTSFIPAEQVVEVGGASADGANGLVAGRIEMKEFRSVPYLLPVPKMDRALGESLPLGGGEGYTLTPKPEDANHVVEAGSVDSLLNTLQDAQPGDLVYLPPGEYFFDDPATYGRSRSLFTIPHGVTLFGSRDETIIRTLPIDDVPQELNTFGLITMGPDTRSSGMTIIGPDTETGPLTGFIQKDGQTIATAYYKPTARGIEIQYKSEVDNISITGFPYAAIVVHGAGADGFVHHSYIAENVRTGLGYGVVLGRGGYVEVAYSKFYKNRHSMDSRGGSYYVHDSHFDNENPMGIGMIFQHAQEMSGAVVIQDNTVVNGIRGIHMFTGHGVISGNVVDTSTWGIALRRAGGADRHGVVYEGYLHDYEIFDNEVRNGSYYFDGIRPQDNVFLDGINVGNLLAELGGRSPQTIPLRIWNSQYDTWRERVPATSPRLQVYIPRSAQRPAKLRGVLQPEFDVVLPDGWQLRQLELWVNNERIYRGNALPSSGDIAFDTLSLPNGVHEFKVIVDSIYDNRLSNRLEEVVSFETDNFWTVVDELRAPVSSGWFGTVDLAMTSDESSGWRYDTQDPAAFFSDRDRKVRESNTTEYLIWEAPDLIRYDVTLYARETELTDVVRLSVSAGEQGWDDLAYTQTVDAASSDGWHKITLRGTLDAPETTHFRIVFKESTPKKEVQLGKVELTGRQ